MSRAIHEVLNDYFTNNSAKIDIVYFGERSGLAEKLVYEILRNQNGLISLRVFKELQENLLREELDVSLLVIFDSVAAFVKNVGNIPWLSNKRMRFKHLVYVPKLNVADITSNVENGFDIDQVSFLINETEKSIKLVSGFMFTSEKCRVNQFKMINVFERETMRWNNSNFYPRKYPNFFNCLIRVHNSRNTDAINAYYGGSYLAELSKIFNMKLKKYIWNKRENFFNGESEKNFDLFELIQGAILDDSGYITSSVFRNERISLTIPLGQPYTSFEKLFLAFKPNVWAAIISTLAILVFAIQVVKRFGRKVQKFVFGKDVKTPVLNLASIVLTGSQLKMPGRNFARFVVAIIILWSLVMRTCYQSQYFKYIQSDARKPQVDTFDEMVEKNFVWYSHSMAPGLEWEK